MNQAHLTQTGFLDLLTQSGVIAKIILMVLLLVSIFCWSIILSKIKRFKVGMRQNDQFMHIFYGGKNMDEILSKCNKYSHSPIVGVFQSGIKELEKLSLMGTKFESEPGKIDNISRALQKASILQISSLEKNISWLATTASAAPFVGLFGTVWGIMNSFQSIGSTGMANLAVVAPGISEALVTTAMGIATAIPAVVAYNFFAGQIKKIAVDMDCFSQDFINIVQRSLSEHKIP